MTTRIKNQGKKNPIKSGTVAKKVRSLVEALDREPWSYIAFAVTSAIIMVVCALAYNSVVPAYQ